MFLHQQENKQQQEKEMSGGAVVMAWGVLAGMDLITRSEVGRKVGMGH